ncbi:MAG: AAA family ATPase [Alistipes senegalensis]
MKDVREVIESARKQRFFDQRPPFLFIDEIHRFDKLQQDSLLGAVEQGVVTLIGATTENPSFEVISPLLSRCQVYILESLEDKDLQVLLDRPYDRHRTEGTPHRGRGDRRAVQIWAATRASS